MLLLMILKMGKLLRSLVVELSIITCKFSFLDVIFDHESMY
jgi:hypothetical protein